MGRDVVVRSVGEILILGETGGCKPNNVHLDYRSPAIFFPGLPVISLALFLQIPDLLQLLVLVVMILLVLLLSRYQSLPLFFPSIVPKILQTGSTSDNWLPNGGCIESLVSGVDED